MAYRFAFDRPAEPYLVFGFWFFFGKDAMHNESRDDKKLNPNIGE